MIDENNLYNENEKNNKKLNLYILDNNINKPIIIKNLNNLYKYNSLFKNNKNKKQIIELFTDDDNFFKIHLICKKITNKEEYVKRNSLLIIFDNMLKKFMKEKYIDYELKSNYISYTDISYNKENDYIISFYIVISHEFGVFKNMNNISILIKEFNIKLRNCKNKYFGDNFIDSSIYNKKIFKSILICKNLFTYVNKESKNITIYGERVYENNKIFNKYYFNKNLIGYYNNTSNISILDHNIKTLENYFNNLKINK